MKAFNLSLILTLSITLSSSLNASSGLGNNFNQELVLDGPPKLIAVKFHADWCGSCKALGPAITDLTNKLDGKPILFTELNFTNITTKNQMRLMASALGIEEIVKNNQGTGFILIIDSETKEVKAKLNKTQSVKEMSKVISSLL